MDQPRDEHGQFITLEKYVMSLMDERFEALRREIAKDLKALDLQAVEYERRLQDLNHAHARAQEAQNTFLREDKYEDTQKSDEVARKLALDRLDERIAEVNRTISAKLEDYITRYEARQREIDQAIDISKGAALEAQRIAEAQTKKNNRNMAILGIVVTIIIAVSNWFGTF